MCRLSVGAFESALGRIHTAATETGLSVISLPGEDGERFHCYLKRIFNTPEVGSPGHYNALAESQIRAYLSGELTKVEIDLDLRVKGFQRKALELVAEIPYGKTRTYGEIARLLGNPGSARAVGRANATNPLPLVIPCHRVVAASGLGGYGGGLQMKRWLLEMEGALLKLG